MYSAKNTQKNAELQYIKGVGPRRRKAFEESGISTIEDLVYYLPRAYIDRKHIDSISALHKTHLSYQSSRLEWASAITVKPQATIVARVQNITIKKFSNNRSVLLITVQDNECATAELLFWNAIDYHAKRFQKGDWLLISGKPDRNRYGKVQFHHPEIEKIDPEDSDLFHQGQILPIYPIPQKLARAGITSKLLRGIIGAVLERYCRDVIDPLPQDILHRHNFLPLQEALHQIHFPSSQDMLLKALQRLKFDEMLFFQLILALRQKGLKNYAKAIPLQKNSPRARAMLESLPFRLTNAQRKVLREILHDLKSGSPMNRLLQGDVGSGKTIVATLAIVYTVDNDFQAVIMAPTEILAEQHYHTISELVQPFNINVVQLVGGQKNTLRQKILEQIESGEADIIVGTHALFQETVRYHRLGLIVIDEQHRFGVLQRAALREKAIESFNSNEYSPHILVMSATPIPRTLAMTLYGDLDVSIIDELPKNRKPIITRIVFESELPHLYQFIREEIQKGYQAYIVYPLVEQSEKIQLKSATEHYEYLQKAVFPDLHLALLHGQMPWYEKEEIMKAFKAGRFQILVATTVIEVGIDVPQATIMVIENAERFGLSQLHQLRGRVGRGSAQSYCFLVTKDRYRTVLKYRRMTEHSAGDPTVIRLQTMEETTDGFKIAEIDLQLRGPGDLLGIRQSGIPEFRFVDLTKDSEIIALARKEAFTIAQTDPHLRRPQHQRLRSELSRRFSQEIHLLEIA